MLSHTGLHRCGPVSFPPACYCRFIFHLVRVFDVAVFRFSGGMKATTPEQRGPCWSVGCSCAGVAHWFLSDWPCRSDNVKPVLFKDCNSVLKGTSYGTERALVSLI